MFLNVKFANTVTDALNLSINRRQNSVSLNVEKIFEFSGNHQLFNFPIRLLCNPIVKLKELVVERWQSCSTTTGCQDSSYWYQPRGHVTSLL